MFPYNGRPTEEFLREYRNKLNELQELMESQGLNLEIKSGGRCKSSSRGEGWNRQG